MDNEAADRRERSARLARRSVAESRRVIRMITTQAADREMLDEAMEILELVRSLSPDDPLAEALAVHLLQSCKNAIGRDAEPASAAARRGAHAASAS